MSQRQHSRKVPLLAAASPLRGSSGPAWVLALLVQPLSCLRGQNHPVSSTAGPDVSFAGELCPLVAAHAPPAGSGWPSCTHQRGQGPQRSEGGSESSTCKAFSLPRPLFSEGPFL